MCESVLPVTFFAIVLLLSPETLMTEIPDTPWAEACAAIVSESLLTLLLKRVPAIRFRLLRQTGSCQPCLNLFVDSPLLGD